MTGDAIREWKERQKQAAQALIADPFSSASGYGDDSMFRALLDEYERNPHQGTATHIELQTRVPLHIAEKAAQIERWAVEERIKLDTSNAERADETARKLKVATYWLAGSTVVLAVATVVLVVVTAMHHGG